MPRYHIVTSPTDGRHRVLDSQGVPRAVFEPNELLLAQQYVHGGKAHVRKREERIEATRMGLRGPPDGPLFRPPPAPQEGLFAAAPHGVPYDAPPSGGLLPERAAPVVEELVPERERQPGDPKVPHLYLSRAGWHVWNPITRAYVGAPGGGAYESRAAAGVRLREVMEQVAAPRLQRHLGAGVDRRQSMFAGTEAPADVPAGGLFGTRRNGPRRPPALYLFRR